jgi:ribosome biogenesis GTPase
VSLSPLGWNDRLENLYQALSPSIGTFAPARAIRAARGRVVIRTEDGEHPAVVAGKLDPGGEPGPPAVGDWVLVDDCGDTSVVRAIVPRSSCLLRRAAGSDRQAQVLAANVDLVLVVEPVDRGPNPRRIERATALTWAAGSTPMVLLSKSDLAQDLVQALARVEATASFVDVLPVSATHGTGLNDLRSRLVDVTAVLLGPSGAGKSSIVNALLQEQRLETGAVRASDRRGRHTTTHRELFIVPSGGCLIDTPGLRELGLWLADADVDGAFPEIETLARSCRFGDCRHEHEPGCTVLEAVGRGELDSARLASYQRLRREAERLERNLDPLGRAELRSRDRAFARLRKAVKRRHD